MTRAGLFLFIFLAVLVFTGPWAQMTPPRVEDADHFVENWRAMVVVLDKNEMRQGYCRARRPE